MIKQASAPLPSLLTPSAMTPTRWATSTALSVNPALFLEGVKTPSTLLAGASFTALFTMTRQVSQTHALRKSQLFFLRVYHCLSLLALLSSITSLVLAQGVSLTTTTAAATTTTSIEFLLVQWSFVMSIFLFLSSTTARILLEFHLYKRRLAGTMVVSMMTGVVTAMMGYVNSTLPGGKNVWTMTREIFKVCLNTKIEYGIVVRVGRNLTHARYRFYGTRSTWNDSLYKLWR